MQKLRYESLETLGLSHDEGLQRAKKLAAEILSITPSLRVERMNYDYDLAVGSPASGALVRLLRAPAAEGETETFLIQNSAAEVIASLNA